MAIAKIQSSTYKNLFNRGFGGTTEPAVADAYVSGFGYFYFDQLPAKIETYVDGIKKADIVSTLCALAIRVTMPTETLNKTTTNGMGGKKWSTPTNFDVGDTVTIAFLELSGTPIRKIISGWMNMIRDIRTGASQIEGDDYAKSKYSATGFYITTKPDGKTIETIDFITGMFPQKNPFDSYNLDIATNEKVEIDIEFNADNIWPYGSAKEIGQKEIKTKAESIIKIVSKAKETYIGWDLK